MKDHIAYYRVSTQKQGQSGLGLEAQRTAVLNHIGTGKLIAEYTEVESGKRHTNRPQLQAALAECKKRKATLVIAKLDRLARNVAFISALMENGTDFIACDMPHANKLTIHILAAVAEHEREMISARTKAALAAAKARGTKLGNPRWGESIDAARQKNNPLPVSSEVGPVSPSVFNQVVIKLYPSGNRLEYCFPEVGTGLIMFASFSLSAAGHLQQFGDRNDDRVMRHRAKSFFRFGKARSTSFTFPQMQTTS